MTIVVGRGPEGSAPKRTPGDVTCTLCGRLVSNREPPWASHAAGRSFWASFATGRQLCFTFCCYTLGAAETLGHDRVADHRRQTE